MKQALTEFYRDWGLYRLAFEEAMQLYWLMPLMQVEEEDLLGQKIVETSRLVCADLAEAWKGRCCYETFLSKLSEAAMGVASIQTWLAFAMECGYVEMEVGQEHCDRYGAIAASIDGLIEQSTALWVKTVA